MSTRTLQFFMTARELWSLLQGLGEPNGVRVFVSPLMENRMEEWNPSRHAPAMAESPLLVFFSEEQGRIEPHLWRERPTAEMGVVLLRVGGLDGSRLYMNDLSAKSDWYMDGKKHTNPAVLRLHQRLKKALTKHLRSGVTLTSLRAEGADLLKGVYFSEGARAFHAAGGELMQRGVENTRFSPVA